MPQTTSTNPWLSENQEVADLEDRLAERTKERQRAEMLLRVAKQKLMRAEDEIEALRLKVKKHEEAVSTALGCLHVIDGEAGVLLNFWGEFATTHQDAAQKHLKEIRKRRLTAHKALCVEWRINDAARRLD